MKGGDKLPITVKVQKLCEDARLPERFTEGAVGFDLYTIEDTTIFNVRAYDKADKVRTGIALEIPKGYHGKIFLRSSTGLNTKLRLANQTGIIDSDYRGEIILLVENLGTQRAIIAKGTRIAQLIIERNVDVNMVETVELTTTARGRKGLGSTSEKKE